LPYGFPDSLNSPGFLALLPGERSVSTRSLALLFSFPEEQARLFNLDSIILSWSTWHQQVGLPMWVPLFVFVKEGTAKFPTHQNNAL